MKLNIQKIKITTITIMALMLLLFTNTKTFCAPPPAVWFYPYDRNFNNFDTTGISLDYQQTEWAGGSGRVSTWIGHGFNNSVAVCMHYNSAFPSDNAYTPGIGPLNWNAHLTFYYRFVEYDTLGNITQAHTLNTGDSLNITYFNPHTNITTSLTSINQSNHIDSTGFQRFDMPIGNSGDSIFINFHFISDGTTDYWMDMDSLSVDNPAVTATPAITKSTTFSAWQNAENNIQFNLDEDKNADMRVTLYSVTGSMVYDSYLSKDKHTFYAGLSAGMYMMRLLNGKNNFTQKIILR